MRNVLIVAYYFPPIGGIGSIRMARFATLLPEFGWQATVIAPARTPHASDPTLECRCATVIRSRSIELSRLGRALPRVNTADGAAGESTSRAFVRRNLRQFAHRCVFYPDGQIGWYPGATWAGSRALRRARFDLIYSSSNPMTAHLVARRLSGGAALPWVAEFRDPWSDRLPRDHPYRRQAQRLMRELGTSATTTIVPTPTLASYYSAVWDREVALVENGHDLETMSGRRSRLDRPTVTHVGTYYPGAQSFSALWEALAQLAKNRAATLPRVRFIGDLPDDVQHEAGDRGIAGLLEGTGFLPHAQTMENMLSSTLLIASGFQGSDPISRGVIPAKLFEYLASGLPILYLGDAADDAGHLLSGQPGCHVVRRDDVQAVKAVLERELDGRLYERDVRGLSRRARTAELAAIFDRAVPRAGVGGVTSERSGETTP